MKTPTTRVNGRIRGNAFAAFAALCIVSAFASAGCISADNSGKGFTLSFGTGQASGTVNIPLYVRAGPEGDCTLESSFSGVPEGYTVTINPESLTQPAFGEQLHWETVTVGKAEGVQAGANITVRFTDTVTSQALASSTVNVSVVPSPTPTPSPSPKSQNCSDYRSLNCTSFEVTNDFEPNLIDRNIQNITLLVGALVAFALVVFIVFIAAPKN